MHSSLAHQLYCYFPKSALERREWVYLTAVPALYCLHVIIFFLFSWPERYIHFILSSELSTVHWYEEMRWELFNLWEPWPSTCPPMCSTHDNISTLRVFFKSDKTKQNKNNLDLYMNQLNVNSNRDINIFTCLLAIISYHNISKDTEPITVIGCPSWNCTASI